MNSLWKEVGSCSNLSFVKEKECGNWSCSPLQYDEVKALTSLAFKVVIKLCTTSVMLKEVELYN